MKNLITLAITNEKLIYAPLFLILANTPMCQGNEDDSSASKAVDDAGKKLDTTIYCFFGIFIGFCAGVTIYLARDSISYFFKKIKGCCVSVCDETRTDYNQI